MRFPPRNKFHPNSAGAQQKGDLPAARLLDLAALYRKPWVVYCKPPFGSPEQVLAYLGRYTHRVAISNSRLVHLDDESVTFTWKDYAGQDRIREMTLSGEEFLRRFLLHVLPERFVRIRYFGLWANRHRQESLACCRKVLLGSPRWSKLEKTDWRKLYQKLTGVGPKPV